MNFDKLRYSKCPHCHQHGLPAFMKTVWHSGLALTCKHCQHKFFLRRFVYVLAALAIAVAVALISRLISFFGIPVPLWLMAIVVIALVLMFEYFAPLEKLDE